MGSMPRPRFVSDCSAFSTVNAAPTQTTPRSHCWTWRTSWRFRANGCCLRCGTCAPSASCCRTIAAASSSPPRASIFWKASCPPTRFSTRYFATPNRASWFFRKPLHRRPLNGRSAGRGIVSVVIQFRALVALVFAATVASAQSAPILIDTDAGSDDVMAVSLLLSQPGVRIDAITAVNGLAHVEAGARNMGRLLDLAGRQSIPAFAGRNAPLQGNAEFPAEWRKISDDLPGVPLPAASRRPETRRAADYLVERLRNAPVPVQILALGPLTNIAEAMQRDASVAAHIREIGIMGGAVRVPGNLQDGGPFHSRNSTAEWNIFIDPMAARIVFRSGVPIRLIALDATNKVKIDSKFMLEFAAKSHSA